MAAPTRNATNTVNAAISSASTWSVSWGQTTTAGSTLICIVSVNPGGTSTDLCDLTMVSAGWTKVAEWQRANSGCMAFWKKENATAESGAVTGNIFAEGTATPKAVYGRATLIEVKSTDGIDQYIASQVGSSLVADTGATAQTTQADELWIAYLCHSNASSSMSGYTTGYTEVFQADTPTGGSGTATHNAALLDRTVAITGVAQCTATISGTFNRTWCGLMMTFKPTAATPPPASSSPLVATDDGRVHTFTSMQLAHSTEFTLPITQAQADAIARFCDMATGQPTKFGAHPQRMITIKPYLLLAPYDKSIQWQGSATAHNDKYYAKNAAGQKIINTGAGSNIYLMYASRFDDPTSETVNGVTGTTWKDWQVKWIVDKINTENAKYAGTPWRGIWMDSMGPFSFTGNPVNPQNGVAYSRAEWLDLIWSMGDWAQLASKNPDGFIVFGNGYNPLGSNTFGMRSHLQGVMSEGDLFSTSQSTTTFPTRQEVVNAANGFLDTQITSGVWVQMLNYAWHWSYDKNSDGTALATATRDANYSKTRRYCIAFALIFNRGTLLMEFNAGTSSTAGGGAKMTIGPWDEVNMDSEYYGVQLGSAIDTFSTATAYEHATNLFRRRYDNGIVLLNVSASTINYTADRNYQKIDAATNYNSGATVPVPPNTGLILATPQAVPTWITRPSIDNTNPKAGDVLTVDVGSASNSPTAYNKQWYTCDASGGTKVIIAAATNTTYTTQNADVGKNILCQVTPVNASGSGAALDSLPTAAVVSAPAGVPVNSVAPTIDGTAAEGNDLQVTSRGTWSNSPTSYTYQWSWSADGSTGWTNLTGETSPLYTAAAADVNRYLSCSVSGVNASGTGTAVRSNVVGPITQTIPANVTAPTMTGGAPTVGTVVAVELGTWSGSDPQTPTYQWQSSASGSAWSNIAGETSQEYTVVQADVGTFLRCLVTMTNTAGSSAAVASNATFVRAYRRSSWGSGGRRRGGRCW